MGKSQPQRHYGNYRGLRTIEVLGANLAGQDKSTNVRNMLVSCSTIAVLHF